MNKKKIIKIIMLVCIIVMIYSIVNIVRWYFENRNNQEIKEEINNAITENNDNETNEIKVDFNSLKEKNSDTVAYLKVNNTKIDYIVVKGNDNKYYLKHNFNKSYNRSGWIFMDYHNKFDGTDKNIIIYGHNTMDGSMFGTLRRVIKKEWYQNTDNHIITLVGENGINYYQVFSSYSIDVEDYYIQTDFKNDDEFDKFVKTLKKRSVYNYGQEVTGKDQILTLSTCTGNGKRRMVLHSKLIKVES